jgi:hypothetical protein
VFVKRAENQLSPACAALLTVHTVAVKLVACGGLDNNCTVYKLPDPEVGGQQVTARMCCWKVSSTEQRRHADYETHFFLSVFVLIGASHGGAVSTRGLFVVLPVYW